MASPTLELLDCRPAAHATLNQLPLEILDQIIQRLIPTPPEIGETRPAPFLKLLADEPWYDFLQCRSTLRNLCSVSRRILCVAQPMLYRVVAVVDAESLASLLRTTIEHPGHALWIRSLSFHLTLTDSTVWRETWRACRKALGSGVDPPLFSSDEASSEIWTLLESRSRQTPSSDFYIDIAQLAVASVLFRAQKLETLLVQVPLHDKDSEYHLLIEMISGAAGRSDGPPCPALTTLVLQCDAEQATSFEFGVADDDNILVPARQSMYRRLICAFPLLSTLECTWDGGHWNFSPKGNCNKPAEPAEIPNIRHLYLHSSFCSTAGLAHVVKLFPRLETLYVTPHKDARTRWEDEIDDDIDDEDGSSANSSPPPTLDQALLAHGQNLRELDVAWLEYSTEGGSSATMATVAAGPTLVSLPMFPSLQKLCIQFELLFSDEKDMEEPLALRLPQSLQELTMEDWWATDAALDFDSWTPEEYAHNYDCAGSFEYRGSVRRMLSELARDSPGRLPNLRKVNLHSRIPWSWSKPGTITLEEQFRDLTLEFKSQGIEFQPCEI